MHQLPLPWPEGSRPRVFSGVGEAANGGHLRRVGGRLGGLTRRVKAKGGEPSGKLGTGRSEWAWRRGRGSGPGKGLRPGG